MAERGWIEAMVERVVAEVLESQTVQLRDEIVRRVRKEISEAPSAETPSASSATSASLASAVAEIQLGTTQREILRALLDGCARYAARVALFVVRGGNATGWQGRGFSSNDAVKDFALDVNAPAVVRAVGDRTVVEAGTTDLDARFLQDFGTPSSGKARLLPLVLKDKVAALVYADGGTEGTNSLDAGALDLLVLSTSAWLEIHSLRKQAQKEPAVERAEAGPVAVEEAAASQSDPFAAHTPGHAMAAAAAAEAPPPATAALPDVPVAVVEPEPVVAAEDAVAVSPAVPPAVSDEEQAIHQKAQRFARLLVDEIKLYNLAKVTEGRKNKDLYDRLKETIEKSRATFAKRYGNTLAASGDYFQQELIRSLAEDDISIMGANFRH
ncbi:MAG: hypothetical protein WCC22_03820 [Terriglobales bacterium]